MLVVAAAAAVVGLVPAGQQTHTAAALQAGCTWPAAAAAVVAAVVAAGLRRTDHSLLKQHNQWLEDAVHLVSAHLLLTPKLFVSGSVLLFPEDVQPTSLYLQDTKTHFLLLANMHTCVCVCVRTHTYMKTIIYLTQITVLLDEVKVKQFVSCCSFFSK